MLGLLEPLTVAPMVLVAVLCLWALLDCARTPGERVRYLPKPLWLLFLLSAPVVGGLAWVYLGKRPEPRESPQTRRRARLMEPDPSSRSGSGGI
ncbi:PLD nuclease N-terminal domain-containing protein [Streptomyces sp. NBC_00015]|uniref:PLD nuclease N-terminal domain-containing protein n=1 Tax=unclassified Streptomyces TaxID=2593676 RepID=UPI0022548708|nr:PLD nuclease N-terminal domain-containing protein [Streptomyces sp. NBC_00103]MCX5369495.1 PLD nuclease N-terminal domain-containing protein [Streptomyces sp. NBC_00103]